MATTETGFSSGCHVRRWEDRRPIYLTEEEP
jgi:hypothetical protein